MSSFPVLPAFQHSFSPLIPLFHNADVKPPTEALKLRSVDETSAWKSVSHIYPAAFPRTKIGCAVRKPYSRQPKPTTASETSDQVLRLFELQQSARLNDITSKHMDEPQLWISLKQYTPQPTNRSQRKRGKRGLTIIALPALGFSKEIAEPFFRALLSLKSSAYEIEEIWSLDHVMSGDSAVINRDHLGQVLDWNDFGRDVAQFVLTYLPRVTGGTHPYQLPTVANTHEEEEQIKLARTSTAAKPFPSFRGRHIALFGHSIGGIVMVSAAHILNGLISGLMCVDPNIHRLKVHPPASMLISGALKRKDAWSSRQAALEGFQKAKGFSSAWTPEILRLFVDCALYEDDQGTIRLKCERYQEALACTGPLLGAAEQAAVRLSSLEAGLNVHFTLSDPPRVAGFAADEATLRRESSQTNQSVTVMNCGHLIVQEDPVGLAQDIHQRLNQWTEQPMPKSKL